MPADQRSASRCCRLPSPPAPSLDDDDHAPAGGKSRDEDDDVSAVFAKLKKIGGTKPEDDEYDLLDSLGLR